MLEINAAVCWRNGGWNFGFADLGCRRAARRLRSPSGLLHENRLFFGWELVESGREELAIIYRCGTDRGRR
jgi:hypothetical protein